MQLLVFRAAQDVRSSPCLIHTQIEVRTSTVTGQPTGSPTCREIVLTTDDELQRLAAGSIGYETVAAALSSVQPPGVLAMLDASAR